MEFALTTRWNAGRHSSGEAMLEEILALGFSRVELGYDLRLDLVPGVEAMVSSGAIRADSVHNFCPVPVSAPRGHPELFTLGSVDSRERQLAVRYTTETIRFAQRIGAGVVVMHAGNVKMKHSTPTLLGMFDQGQEHSLRYEKLRLKLQTKRERKVRRQLDWLYLGLEKLLPVLEETGVALAIENLPSWESIPTEIELEELILHFDTPRIRAWYDLGHAQIRQNLGFINMERWLERLAPYLGGMHVHDVRAPDMDHLMPPRGDIDFARLRSFGRLPILRVIEPTPRTPREDIAAALTYLREAWSDAKTPPVEADDARRI